MGSKLRRSVLTCISTTLFLAAIISIYCVEAIADVDNSKLRALIIPSEPWIELDIQANKGEGAVYYDGDGIYFNVKSNRDCYLYIFEISTSGEVRLLYPNIRDRSNRLKGGAEHRIPKGYTLSVAPPEGIETIIAIATEKPIRENLPWMKRSLEGRDFLPIINVDPERFLEELKREELSGRHSRRWAADVTWFKIKKQRLPEYGQVYVTTNPSAARIFIDGREIGKSPLNAVRLSYGVHEITAINEGYYTETRRVAIGDRGTEYVHIEMKKIGSASTPPIFNRREILKERITLKDSNDLFSKSFKYNGYSGKVDILPSDKGFRNNRIKTVTGYFSPDGEPMEIFFLDAEADAWNRAKAYSVVAYPFEVTVRVADAAVRSVVLGGKYFSEVSLEIIVSYIGE